MVHYDIWMRKYLENRESIVKALRDSARDVEEVKKKIPIDELIKPLELPKVSLSEGMCFVDGGEGLRETMGAGVYFVRASALHLSSVESGGEFIRDLDLGVIAYDDYTKERVEFMRETLEHKVAAECILKHKPAFAFLDGSLYVKSQQKRIECAEFFESEAAFSKLLESAQRLCTQLVGVSEDSKSRLLKRHLESRFGVKFPAFLTDPTILEMLSPHKTYMTATLSPKRGSHTYKTVYIKPMPHANPMRVDFAPWIQDVSTPLSVVAELSKASGGYGYPMPLYLAHLDSAIPERQADWNTKRIVDHAIKDDEKTGGAVFGRTRRDVRPK